MSWGYHLTADCKACKLSLIQDPKNIYNFAKSLVSNIDMIAYGEPFIVHFGKEDKTGYTLVQLIETSNICAHFCDDSGDAYIDVFSCKPFDEQKVLQTIDDFFKPVSYNVNFMERQA